MENDFYRLRTEVRVLSEKTNALEEQIGSLDSIKEILIELKVLTTQQIEGNAQRDEMLKEYGTALTTATNTLQTVILEQEQHSKRLEANSLESKARIEAIDKEICNLTKRGSIDIGEIGKRILMMGVSALVTAILALIVVNYK